MALTMNQYCSFQLFALMLLTMVQFEYLVLYKPFNTPLLQRLELFNEATSLFLLSLCVCFTDYIDDEASINIVGWTFNAAMIFNMSVHLFFLGHSVVADCK